MFYIIKNNIFANQIIKHSNKMEKIIYNYEQPEIEIVEIQVEKGFENSPNADGGGGGAEDGKVDW